MLSPSKSFKACDPINNLLMELLEKGFTIQVEKIEDYHFHQFYFKLSGQTDQIKNFNPMGFKKIENKYICDCHWSTVELTDSKIK